MFGDVAAIAQLLELRLQAMRALAAWDNTVLQKSHDGMMQERMECLRAAIEGPNVALTGRP
jgi:hypothetical protein